MKTYKKIFLLIVFTISLLSNTYAQNSVTISGIIKDKTSHLSLPFVNIVLKTEKDSVFVNGTVSNEEGRFSLINIKAGNYILEASFVGYSIKRQSLFVGNLTQFLDVNTIELEENSTTLNEVVVTGRQEEISEKMDKKTFSLKDNISQSGGSVLQAMQNLPSVTVQDGKVQLRGNDKVTVLIDGKTNGSNWLW